MSLEKGLVGHWTMDDADTDGSTLYDRSAYDNHGTINGPITTGVSSPIGQAYSFDGTSGGIQLTKPEPNTITSSFTITTWCVLDSGQDTSNIFSTSNDSFRWRASSGDTHWVLLDDGSGNSTYFGSSTLPFDTYFYYTVVYDSSVPELRFYIDGQLDDTISVSETSLQPYDEMYIGAYQLGSEVWGGEISDLRLYNRVLSESEINQLYQMREQRTQSNDLAKGLVGHWTMDDSDTSGGTIYDSSGYDNHGTLNNSPTTGTGGKINEAYDFTNDGSTNVSIDASSGTGLDFSGDISYSFWINHQDTLDSSGDNDYKTVLSYDSNNNSSFIIEDSGELNVSVNIDGSRTGFRSSFISENTWYHIVVTYDSSSDTLSQYIDGALDNFSTITSGTRSPAGTTFYISDPSRSVGGLIDDVRVYNRVLSASEVSRLYNKRT